MAKTNSRVFKFILLFLILLASVFAAIKYYSPDLPLYELSTQLIRKHELPGLTLSPNDTAIFRLLNSLNLTIGFLDSHLRFFPSWIKINFWKIDTIYVILFIPILLLVAGFMAKTKRHLIIYSLFIIWIFPITWIAQNLSDKTFIKFNYGYLHPFSRSPDWIWITDDEGEKDYVSRFVYSWNQKQPVRSAEISLSCLGHYRLKINGKTIGRGPVFAQSPKVYVDSYSLIDEIIIGDNRIEIECEYLSSKTHEHEIFTQPGLYITGRIGDGILTRNLGDWRFWRGGVAEDIVYKNKLADGGYSEADNLETKSLPTGFPKRLEMKQIKVDPRPIKSLIYEDRPLIKQGRYLDLGHYSVGYLTLSSSQNNSCTATISFHDGYNDFPDTAPQDSQIDQIKIPAGKFSWEQFSRRAGRYIQINSDCQGKITPNFSAVGYPYDSFIPSAGLTDQDKAIFQIAKTSLDNGLQDQIEDSLVREKALYVGDALAVSKCLPNTEGNLSYIKSAIQSFADSQLPGGAIPAMAHSSNPFIIPDYSLQWIVLLETYLSKSGDKDFAQKLLPNVRNVLSWAEKNESTRGFLFDKNAENWWIFIDWTPLDRSQKYITPLQLWYLESLKSARNIFLLTGEKINLDTKIISLENNLTETAFSKTTGIFSDSFSESGDRSATGLLTNALAGKLGYLNDSKSLTYFKGNLYLDSPFSETWIIEWLIRLGQKDLALKTLRTYWGSMVNLGASSIYEKFNINDKLVDSSHSHAWGCSPVFLFNKIYK